MLLWEKKIKYIMHLWEYTGNYDKNTPYTEYVTKNESCRECMYSTYLFDCIIRIVYLAYSLTKVVHCYHDIHADVPHIINYTAN